MSLPPSAQDSVRGAVGAASSGGTLTLGYDERLVAHLFSLYSVALGHPLGATGTKLTATLLHGMKRDKQKLGMVTMCIGTGMGAAMIFEMC
jgi:hypothetical protein